MPIGEYENFEECRKKNADKKDPDAYCGAIERDIKESKENDMKKSNLVFAGEK